MPPVSPPSSRKERALALLRENRLDEAKALCEDVCRTEDQPGAWYLLGIIHEMQRNPQAAQTCYRKAIVLKPDYADAHFHLGVSLAALNQFDEGIASLQEAARLMPGHGAIHAAIGNAQVGLRRFEDAVISYRRALGMNPRDVEARVNLGNTLAELGRPEEAIAAYRQAIGFNPRFLDAYHNLGLALVGLHRPAEAIDSYQAALRIDPNHPTLLTDLGVAFAFQKKHGDAIANYRRALECSPDKADTHYNLANALWTTGKFDDAVKHYRDAIRLQPDYADAHVNLGLVSLSRGHFRDGWKEYDWQWRREDAPVRPYPCSPWDGTDLAGRDVFLHAEQGIGDELFFLRFVPWLRKRGAGRVLYRPTAKIASLISRVNALDRVVVPDAQPSGEEYLFSVGDLPRLLGMDRVGQIPPPIDIPALSELRGEIWSRLEKLGPPPYLGVTWRAGTTKKNSLYKEVPPASLAAGLRTVPGTVLILQRHPGPEEIEAFAQSLARPVHDLSALNEDLEQILALLALVDDYVGVPNTNMHLRAGLGNTARVLVPAPPDWRWMAEGRESPWFPGFRVYRQGYDESWDGALQELADDLRRALAQ